MITVLDGGVVQGTRRSTGVLANQSCLAATPRGLRHETEFRCLLQSLLSGPVEASSRELAPLHWHTQGCKDISRRDA